MWISIGAIAGLIGVAIGALTSHGIKEQLTPDAFAQVQTAVDYQFFHALALVMLGCLLKNHNIRPKTGHLSGVFFSLGLLLFSGGIYLKYLLSSMVMAQFIPLGGLGFMAGWLLLAAAAVGYERKTR
jgi:uncharacterized membrane protein YgdD (TMEM256/DUF423 family)